MISMDSSVLGPNFSEAGGKRKIGVSRQITGEPEGAASMHEIWEALVEGAPFSFINLGVLAFGVGVIIDRAWYIRMNYSVDAAEFMNRIRKLVQAGNIDRAIRQCEAKAVPLLEVVKSGLTQVNRGEEAVIASMEEKMSEVIPALEKRTGALWTLANIATLIGLLGTISGLIRAFKAVGTIDDPSQKTALLSAGIAEAMFHGRSPRASRADEAAQARDGKGHDAAREPPHAAPARRLIGPGHARTTDTAPTSLHPEANARPRSRSVRAQ
jgi:biopolymer transport protein ExbB/TolQ